jgi:cation diffusion facilitator family transporter
MNKVKVACAAVIGGVFVFVVKLIAYAVSNSVALLSDALESIINILASGLMLFSVEVSKKPPDESHNYGHQKIEDISRMIEGLFILAAALLIVYTAANRLLIAPELMKLDLAIGISVVATSLNAGSSWLLLREARATGSAALEGDAKHLLSDVISSATVWVGLFVVWLTGYGFIDSVLAFLIAALIGKMGVELMLKSASPLMEQACKYEEDRIKEVLLRHKYKFIGFHELKTRRVGNQVFAELHLSVDGALSVNEAHELTDHLEEELKSELPNVNLTIHVEPKE